MSRPAVAQRAVACFALLAAVMASPARSEARVTAPKDPQSLGRALQALATSPRLGGASVGMLVTELGSGRVLLAREADKLVPVASNTKIVTASAALAVLGPTYRFRTAFYGKLEDGVIDGDLVVKGYGDPTLGARDLWLIARRLYDRGVRRIKGGVVLDASYFDRRILAPLYATKKDDWYYRPAVGPLTIEENAIGVRIDGGKNPGDPARVTIQPKTPYVRVTNRVVTISKRRRNYVRIKSRGVGASTVIELIGRVRAGHRGRVWRKRIAHPGRYFGMTLRRLLRRVGIRVGRRDVRRGKAPEHDKPLYVFRSIPLGAILRYTMKASSNFIAETLVKVMGAEKRREPGTWPKGLAVIAQHMQRLGIAGNAYSMKNGSGLYEGNRFSPRQIATVLRATLRDVRVGPDFHATLPIAGYDGTLRRRFRRLAGKGLVRAKTGTLSRVVALSGVAASPKRPAERLVFSFLVSELPKKPGQISRARRIVDRMASLLVRYLGR